MRRTSLITLAALVSATLGGCNDQPSVSKEELDRAKNSKFDDKAQAQMAAGMQAGADASRKQQSAWAAENADKLAKVNAERARMGRPPIGQ